MTEKVKTAMLGYYDQMSGDLVPDGMVETYAKKVFDLFKKAENTKKYTFSNSSVIMALIVNFLESPTNFDRVCLSINGKVVEIDELGFNTELVETVDDRLMSELTTLRMRRLGNGDFKL